MHVSLDGFVGGPNGEMDWINADNEIFEYVSIMNARADMAIYGRKTFEMMEAYWPTAADQPEATGHDIEHGKWYTTVAKVVLSRTMKGDSSGNTQVIKDNVKEEVSRIKTRPGKQIVIFGSPNATHTLMHHDLVDEYWLFVNPVLLGNGIPMFRNITERQNMQLIESRKFKSGVVMMHLERKDR